MSELGKAKADTPPARILHKKTPKDLAMPFKLDAPQSVVLDTVKRGQDDPQGHRSVILRIYEQFGGQANGTLTMCVLDCALSVDLAHVVPSSCLTPKRVELVNLMEDHISDLDRVEVCDEAAYTVGLSLRGYEIKTVKISW